jgi:hypothetical protein
VVVGFLGISSTRGFSRMGMRHTRKHNGSDLKIEIIPSGSGGYEGVIFEPHSPDTACTWDANTFPVKSPDLHRLKRQLDEKAGKILGGKNHDCSRSGCPDWKVESIGNWTHLTKRATSK